MKQAFVFPGQGAQFPGMAKDLYDNCASAKAVIDEADHILGFSISGIMFGDDADALRQTKVTQPAVFIHSVAAARYYREKNPAVVPDMTAGHSLGEFSALVAAGALSFEEGLKLVSARAGAMQKACDIQPGGMAAVLSLEAARVEEICREITETGRYGVVVPANYNCNGQIVVSGTVEAVQEACVRMKEAGARRALPLQVGGAFHSPLMEPAREELAAAIEKAEFRVPECPVYQNVTSLPSSDPDTMRRNLLTQLTSPVKWTQSILNMVSDAGGPDSIVFREFGPGTVLQGLVRKICPEAGVCGYDD